MMNATHYSSRQVKLALAGVLCQLVGAGTIVYQVGNVVLDLVVAPLLALAR
jgi:hypothetical protein